MASQSPFLKWLTRVMKDEGLNQTDLDKKLKTRGAVNHWFKRGDRPHRQTIKRLATLFGVTEGYIANLITEERHGRDSGAMDPSSDECLRGIAEDLGRLQGKELKRRAARAFKKDVDKTINDLEKEMD